MGFGGVQVQMAQVVYVGWVERNCVQRSKRGLNFKSLHEFNLALLRK